MAAQGRAGSGETASRADTRGRGRLLALVAVLMLVVLAVALWASGMGRAPTDPDIGAPTYQSPTGAPSDTAAGQTR